MQEIVIYVIGTSNACCAILFVALKKMHVLTYIVATQIVSLLLSQTLYIDGL